MTASSDFKYSVIAGAVSGVVTRIIIEPLDVLKIRFQLQVEHINEARPVRGSICCVFFVLFFIFLGCSEVYMYVSQSTVPTQIFLNLYGLFPTRYALTRA